MITYSWTINSLGSYPEYQGEQNVVFVIYASYSGTNGRFGAGIYLSQSLILDKNGPFTPYAELTEQQVMGWLLAAITPEQISQMQADIAKQISADEQNSFIQLPLPWSN